MKMSRIFLVGLVIFGLLVMGNVSAKSVDTKTKTPDAVAIVKNLTNAGSNWSKVWATLSEKEQKAVVDYLKVTSIDSGITAPMANDRSAQLAPSATATKCSTLTAYRCGTNTFGRKLWCYFQDIDWCFDGSKVTKASRYVWSDVYELFWSADGEISKQISGGVGQSSYRSRSNGRFKCCISSYGCIQYAYPWVDETVYGTGSYKSSTGGG